MTDQTMAHERWQESSGLYVLDALDARERADFEQHLASCAECTEEVRSLRSVAGALPFSVPQMDPPLALRARVLAAAGTPVGAPGKVVQLPAPPHAGRRFAPVGWLSAAALLVIAAGLGSYSWSLEQQIDGLQDRLRDTVARLERSEAQATIAARAVSTAESRLVVLLAPDMRQVNLDGQPVAPRASGRAFWSRSRGLVFTAANLPALPQGRTYQLWMVAGSTPISAGVMAPDPNGAVAHAFITPQDVPAPDAIALTIEPAGGVPAPTGEKYLVGLTH